MRRLLALLLLLPLPALAEGRRVAVVPFAALSGDVPPRTGTKAAAMLATELRKAAGLTLVASEPATAASPAAEALERARAAVREARALWEARRPRQASEALGRALSDYGAAGAQVEEVGEVADAWALRAAAQSAAGQDAEAEASLVRALALAPGRALPLARTSPLFSREVERVRRALLAGPRGRLLVESTPAGAAVVLDGVASGATPVLVRDVPPGTHLWRVRLPSGEWAGGAVEVAAGKEARVRAEAGGSGPEARLGALLARNRLDAELLAAAREHAAAQGAETLLLGALHREGAALALETFVFHAASGELRRLPRTPLDAELLSAGEQFLALAAELARGGALGEAVRLPGPVSTAALAVPARQERAFAVPPSGEAEEAAPRPGTPERQEDGARQPLKRAPVRRP